MSFGVGGCWCRSWAEKGDEARQFLAGFFGTYRFCQNFGRESWWWASFRGAARAAWGGISYAIAILVMAITSCSWTKSLTRIRQMTH